eukprot:scaffold2156_cov430-Prasinococcus_capsulatus_cf.AAC.1
MHVVQPRVPLRWHRGGRVVFQVRVLHPAVPIVLVAHVLVVAVAVLILARQPRPLRPAVELVRQIAIHYPLAQGPAHRGRATVSTATDPRLDTQTNAAGGGGDALGHGAVKHVAHGVNNGAKDARHDEA